MAVEILTVALLLVSGALTYFLLAEKSELELTRRQRDYYYRLAVQYYGTALKKDSELKTALSRAGELEERIKIYEKRLNELKNERRRIEKALKEVLKANKSVEKKVDRVLKLSRALARLEELQRRLEELVSVIEAERSRKAKKVKTLTDDEVERINRLRKDVERAIERLLDVADRVEKSSKEYSDFVAEIKGRTDEIVGRFEEELNYYGESFSNAVSKVVRMARNDKEVYRQIRSDSGSEMERFLPVFPVFRNGKRSGYIKPEDVYHVGGYAPFDFILVRHSRNGGKKRVTGIIFAELKTGYSGLSEYEYDFARKIIALKSDFIKYALIRVAKTGDGRKNGVWRAQVHIVESEDQLKEFINRWDEGYLKNE